ncbi:NAD(P)H-hydrate dehydratase [Candidatus Halobeggiatoa sp. HSG11]|nr:NAD(P)H-hydrate dehydratase [Candidatus Halobeggiatoa sp. HSG11]
MKHKPLPLPLYSASQVRELDRIAIEEMGIPGACLMERAGSVTFQILKSHWPQAHRIAVLCGIGNNSGDGYVLARLAHLAGYEVIVLQVGDTDKLKNDALNAFKLMVNIGLIAQTFTAKKLTIVDVIVDALFGTGINRNLRGQWQEVIEATNICDCPVLSVDIPSGLNADTGTVLGIAIQAEATVSFIGLKQGLFTGSGPEHCGKIYFDDLQIPSIAYKQLKTNITRFDCYDLILPKRSRIAHKGYFGHVLVIGGDSGMTGAVRLAAEAAARIGAGLVSVATRNIHAAIINLTRPEIMVHGVETPEELIPLLDKASVIAIGPGLGQSLWARAMLEAVKDVVKPVVVDADALNLLAKTPFRFINSVLTPHPGEAARLLEKSTTTIHNDRLAAVRALQIRFGNVCVLKGAGTLIAGPENAINICNSGNPGMACGGMGDVLTGVIAGLLAQGLSSYEAASVGVYIHGKAGDQAALDGERGLLPSDLMPWLRHYANP